MADLLPPQRANTSWGLGLPVDRVQHMRRVALSAIKEAGEALMNGKDLLAMDRERRTDH